MSFVRIEHPDVGEATVSDRAVRHYKQRGWEPAGPAVAPVEAGGVPLQPLHRNASTEAWQAYAKNQGMAADLADGMSRNDLVAFYLTDTQEP